MKNEYQEIIDKAKILVDKNREQETQDLNFNHIPIPKVKIYTFFTKVIRKLKKELKIQ